MCKALQENEELQGTAVLLNNLKHSGYLILDTL